MPHAGHQGNPGSGADVCFKIVRHLYPRNRINVLMPVFIVMQVMRLPAYVVLLLWFALQLWYSLSEPAMGGGIAFAAHVGGFVAGMLLVPLFVPFHDLLGRGLKSQGRPGT